MMASNKIETMSVKYILFIAKKYNISRALKWKDNKADQLIKYVYTP